MLLKALILSLLGGKPITAGLFMDNFSTTQSKVGLVAGVVSVMTLAFLGSRPNILQNLSPLLMKAAV